MDRNSKEFKALQAKWDEKLKDSGFTDIEQRDGRLKHWAASYFRIHYNATSHDAIEKYYRAAGQFLYEHKFKDERERLIWQLHSEGLSGSQIIKEMNKRGFVHLTTNRTTAEKIVQKLAKLMVESWKK